MKKSVELRYELLEAVGRKGENADAELARRIIKQGVSVLKKRYE